MARLIVDVSSVVKRCLFAGKDEENGYKVEVDGKVHNINSAIYGYDLAINSTVMVLEALHLNPSNMILVVEGKNSKIRRTQIYPAYKESKSQRAPQWNEEFAKARDLYVDALRKVGALVVTQDSVEADDVIAYLVKRLKGKKVIFSEDGDLAQLLDADTSQWRQGAMLLDNPYGPFPEKHILLYKALVGDSSDNIKGAAGFGEKAWLDMLVNYGDCLDALDDMIRRRDLDELADDVAFFKPFQKVLNSAQSVFTSYEVARLRDEWVDTLRSPLQWKAGIVLPATDHRLKKWGQQCRIVTAANFNEALTFLQSKVAETQEFCLDLETTTPDESDEWLQQRTEKGGGVDVIGSTIVSCGLSFGANGQYGFYASAGHADTANITMAQLSLLLTSIPKYKVTVAHNAAGFELPVLYKAFGQAWANNGWRGMFPNMVDSAIAASYWDENQPTFGLKKLSKLLQDYEQETYEQVTTLDGVQYKMHQLSAEHVFSYGMDDCFTAQGLYNFFKVVMECEDTFDAFMRIEQKPMYLSALSYVDGTPISLQRLRELKKADDEALPKLEATLHSYLIEKGWEGTVCPTFDEMTPAAVKFGVKAILGHELQTAVRKTDKLAALIREIGHEDAPLLAQIVDCNQLAQLNDWVQRRFTAKPEFNPGSFVQIGRLMYEVMHLPIRLRNRPTDAMRAKGIREGNPQTDDDAINMAIKRGDASEKETGVLSALLEMKSIRTRTGLYWEPYPKFMHWSDNRLHPELRQCATNTRRHTAANPNIQQMDSASGGARTIILPHKRDAVFVSLDLAGQEIRLLGDYSRDENIMAAYIGDPPKDLHSFTAAMIQGVTYDEFRERYKSKDEAVAAKANAARQAAKTVFFASSYGAMAPKIALGLGVSEEVAQSYLDALDKAFPRVKKWKAETEEFAARNGWVSIMGGTRRHLRPLILSEDSYTSSKALRQASNARIQSAGGNQIRTIMGRVWDSNLLEQYDMRFYWPVHDEVCFSVHRDHAVPVIKALHAFMCEQFLDVLPSASSIGIGRNYGDLIEIGEVADEELIRDAVARCFGEAEAEATA